MAEEVGWLRRYSRMNLINQSERGPVIHRCPSTVRIYGIKDLAKKFNYGPFRGDP